jgi:hypothetical protein
VRKRPTAKRWQTLTTDDQMLCLVKGWLTEPRPKPVKDSGYFWSELLEDLWPRLSNDNCVVEIIRSDVRGLADRPGWQFRFPTGAAPNGVDRLDRRDFLHWVEDRIRTPPMPPSLTDEDLRRWVAVVEARRTRAWGQTYEAASKWLNKTSPVGKPRTARAMKLSYSKVQRMRRKLRPE